MHLRQVFTIILLSHSLVNILMGEHLQYQGKIIGVKKQLCHVFKLEDIFTVLAARHWKEREIAELTRAFEPFKEKEKSSRHSFAGDLTKPNVVQLVNACIREKVL